MDHYEELNLEAVSTESLAERPSNVHISDFGSVCPPQANVGSFIGSLPDILAGRDIKRVVEAIVMPASATCRSSSATARTLLRLASHR